MAWRFLAVAISIGFWISEQGGPSTATRGGRDSRACVEMTLSVERAQLQIGQDIPFRLEIYSSCTRPVLVGRFFSPVFGLPSGVYLSIEDDSGNTHGSGNPVHFDPTKEFTENWWVELHHSSFYGLRGRLNESSHRILYRPGRYQFMAHYALASGIPNPKEPRGSLYNPAANRNVDLVRSLSSNTVSIEILPDGR